MNRLQTVLAITATAVVVGGTTATASSLITSKNIQDGSIQNRDIRPGVITMSRLKASTQKLIRDGLVQPVSGGGSGSGPAGPSGPKGDKGATGDDGAKGAKGNKGDKGARGPKGAKGDTGPRGPKGPKGDKGATGPRGPKGNKGDKGDKGDTGATGPAGGLSDYSTHVNNPAPNTNPDKAVSVDCPAGTVVIGGGAQIKTTSSQDRGAFLVSSTPVGNSWLAEAEATSTVTFSWSVTAHVICAKKG